MTPKCAFSINDFCLAHDISKTKFYSLLKEGNGPEIIKVGRRTLISVEAAQKWRERLAANSRGQKNETV